MAGNEVMKILNKILISVYALLCLVQFPIAERWGGYYSPGAIFALVAFSVPILFTICFSSLLAKLIKKPFAKVFNTSFTVIIICCGIFMCFESCFMLTFSF
jgi:hypothetical protein